MYLKIIDDMTKQARWQLLEQIIAKQDSGECPTCQDVYPSAADRIYYEDDNTLCILEAFPRNLGHTIVMVKQHYDDISEMPPDIAALVYPVIYYALHALKTHLGAEKVYLCTMCDGKRNHLHFQLIPRFDGDIVRGSQLFVKERQQVVDYTQDIIALRHLMSQIS